MPRGLTFDDVLAMAERFPEVDEGTHYGTRAIRVRGRMIVRLREDGETIVLRAGFVVRDHLMSTQPAVFFITDHYRDYPAVLVRLANVKKAQLADLLEAAWREYAPKRLVAEFDRELGTAPKPTTRRSR